MIAIATVTYACALCEDAGIREVWRVPDGREFYVRPSRLLIFRHDYPQAEERGAVSCICVEQRRMEAIGQNAGIPPKRRHCTFEKFDALPASEREGKEEARYCAELMAEGQHLWVDDREYPGLLIGGENGMGKSGLAACIMRARIAAGVSSLWIDFGKFLEDVFRAQERQFKRERNRLQNDDGPDNPFEFVEAVARVPFLVLDDLGDAARDQRITDYQRERLYTIVRTRYEYELPSVFTSNLNYKEMVDMFGRRIAERLGESWRGVTMVGKSLRFG